MPTTAPPRPGPHMFRRETPAGPHSPADLESGEAHRRTATDFALDLFAREPRLRALRRRGFVPLLDPPRLVYLDPSGRFDLVRGDLRLNRLDRGPLHLCTSFYLDGRLVACANQRGVVARDAAPARERP